MPYITKTKRKALAKTGAPINGGELNYQIHEVIKSYLDGEGDTYTAFNTVLGALEAVKQEFYRRKVVPYEERKIKENGDIPLYALSQ